MQHFEKQFYQFLLLLALFILHSCSNSSYNFSVLEKKPEYVEGVDSLIIAQSDSIINFLFVDFSNEEKAKKLAKEAQFELNQADSIWQRLKEVNKDSTQLFSLGVSDSNATTLAESSHLLKTIQDYLHNSEKKFQQSIRLNPFVLNTKDGLAQTYTLWAEIEKPKIYYEKAVSILRAILDYDKGEHLLFYKLGECYFHLEQWEQALANYRQAEKVLLATTITVDSTSFIILLADSTKKDWYFIYLYSQAVSLARTYNAQEALSVIKKAIRIAPSDEKRKIAERFEEWLNWDNGNIRTAEQKNQILKLIKAAKYAESVSELENLKRQLSDQFAIDEIEWRIAVLEFNYLDRKKEACNRLLNIINPNKINLYFSPNLITTYDKYITDCGVMHFSFGMEFLKSANYKQAQEYLEQGAKLNWYGNYKCQLELAKLNRHDPQTSLEIIEKVLHSETDLTDTEKLAALEIKLSALKKLGPQHLVETKQIYQTIKELQKK